MNFNPYAIGGLGLAGLSLLTMGNPDRALVETVQTSGSQAAAHADIEAQRAEAENKIANLRLSGVCVLLSPVDTDGNPVSLNTPGLMVPNLRKGVAVCDRTGNTAMWDGDRLTAFAQSRNPAMIQQFLSTSNISGVAP
jgi:hypothetical protein